MSVGACARCARMNGTIHSGSRRVLCHDFRYTFNLIDWQSSVNFRLCALESIIFPIHAHNRRRATDEHIVRRKIWNDGKICFARRMRCWFKLGIANNKFLALELLAVVMFSLALIDAWRRGRVGVCVCARVYLSNGKQCMGAWQTRCSKPAMFKVCTFNKKFFAGIFGLRRRVTASTYYKYPVNCW